MDKPKGEVTLLLDRLAAGDRSAEDALMPHIYAELHRLASAQLRGERNGHTLQPTALVHEAYMRLCQQDRVNWLNREHFFGIAARQMRRILIDYARQRKALKRGDGNRQVPLHEALVMSDDQLTTMIELDDLLHKLAGLNARQAQVVEMRFFAGFTEEEIASILHVNVRTVKRDWLVARAWLHAQLKRD